MVTSRKYLGTAIACALALQVVARSVHATGVPIGGFLPMVGFGLTDEFNDDFNFAPVPSDFPTGTFLGAGGELAHYDVALLDTGAAVSIVTAAAFDDFGLGSPSPGEPDGYFGHLETEIKGATGSFFANNNDPAGLYVGGLQGRGMTPTFSMQSSALRGQTNTSMITLPEGSELPNVVGLPFASQYATSIRSSEPQIFTLNGRTVRTPSIDFLELGSGGGGITRYAPMSPLPTVSFQQGPTYFPDPENPDLLDNPQENPFIPTVIQGGLFLNVNLGDEGSNLTNQSYFFDTGADVTVLSRATALQLGIDAILDAPEFTVAVVGSGGTKQDVPGYYLDSFTIQALGGSITATNVPVLVLNVADPTGSGPFVPGIVGTNMFAGRNLVIDLDPDQIANGPALYISDPVTAQHNWSSASATGAWTTGGNWSGGAPGDLGVANVRNAAASGNQEVNLSGAPKIWEANVSGAAGKAMKLRVASGAKLTTFAGINIEQFGTVQLDGGSLDAQYVEILGGTLTGSGSIMTGSGPIDGQVENRGGTVAPGNGVGTLSIVGRFAQSETANLNIEVGGLTPGTQHDRLVIDGPATLDGILNVSLTGGFAPALGDSFSILAAEKIGGEFASIVGSALPSGQMWAVFYDETEALLRVTLPGDFDGNGAVQSADLAVWRSRYGESLSGFDFLAWQRYFGSSISFGATAIPEPGAVLLALAGAISLGVMTRRRKNR